MGRGLVLWAVIVAGVLASAPYLAQRAALERADRQVELVVDVERLKALSGVTGIAPEEILPRWRDLGVTALAMDDPADGRLAESAGLRVAPRTLEVAVFASAWKWPVGPVIFTGNRVGGYPDSLETTSALLRELGAPLGLIEFAPQQGAPELARLLGYRAVRVHSIPLEELAGLTDGEAAARLARAARERRARVLYVRPLVRGPADLMLARNDAYIADIAARLQKAGLRTGPAQPLPFWTSSLAAPLGAAAAGAAAGLLLLRRLMKLRAWAEAAGVVAAAGLAAVLWLKGYTVLARQGAALAVAIAFPALAVVTAADAARPRAKALAAAPQTAWAARSPARAALAGMIPFLLVTAAGAVLMAGALADTRFLLQIAQFRGVKAAHVVPLLMIGAFWAVQLSQGRWAQWLSAPVRVWHVLAGAFAAFLAYVYVGRTGNDMLPVLEVEQIFRMGLEEALSVRPRTKEFLLGYPALMAGLVLLAAGRPRMAWPCLVAGGIASISVLNTFAHAHSPLALSLLRSAYGLLSGIAVAGACGLAALIAVKWVKGGLMTYPPGAGRSPRAPAARPGPPEAGGG
ncbi:MAG: hypothetical protein H0Z37_09135 [Firmicutes bacterium]|nr:hypothetical protein [Bacillota bacterium]